MEETIKEILERLDKLEKDSHPPIGICDFDGWKELVERVQRLEKDGI